MQMQINDQKFSPISKINPDTLPVYVRSDQMLPKKS